MVRYEHKKLNWWDMLTVQTKGNLIRHNGKIVEDETISPITFLKETLFPLMKQELDIEVPGDSTDLIFAIGVIECMENRSDWTYYYMLNRTSKINKYDKIVKQIIELRHQIQDFFETNFKTTYDSEYGFTFEPKSKTIVIDDLSTKLVINDVEYLIGVPLDGAPILIETKRTVCWRT